MTDLTGLPWQVHLATHGFDDKDEAWAQHLSWSPEEVKQKRAHAEALVRMKMARHAVAQAMGSPQMRDDAAHAPMAAARPNGWDRGVAAAAEHYRGKAHDAVEAVTHPTQAAAEFFADMRRPRTGFRPVDRAIDILGGANAAELGVGLDALGEAADFYHRYGPGQIGAVEDELAREGLLPAPPRQAAIMYRASEPLRTEGAKRPPRTLPGKALAMAPELGLMLTFPAAAPWIAGMDGIGEAYDRARETGAPDNLRTDAGIAASGVLNAAVTALQLRALRGPDPAGWIARAPEGFRSEFLDRVGQTFARSAGAAGIGGAQQTTGNAIARMTVDPDRRWDEGVYENMLFSAGLGAVGGGRGSNRQTPRPRLLAPPTPVRPKVIIQLGGAHRDVTGLHGYEAHHMPSNKASPLSKGAGPAIAMKVEHHRRTASWGAWPEAKAFQAKQNALIKAGKFGEAQDMDIADIRAKFGDEYEGAIEKVLEHTKKTGLRH